MSDACEYFGGRNLVETKIFATLMDLQKEGFPEVANLPHKALDALSSVSPALFQQLMFVSGRALDTAFPQLRELSRQDVVEWSNHRGISFCVGSNGEKADERLSAVIALQQSALSEVLSQSDEQECSETQKDIDSLRSLFQSLAR
jgi:hypothetical protein